MDRRRVRRMGLGGKLSFANVDTTGKHCQTLRRILNEGRGGGGNPLASLCQGKEK